MEEKKSKSTIILSTRHKNRYLYDRQLKKTLLCHPVLIFLIHLKIQGINPSEWVESIQGSQVTIPELGNFERSEVNYYLKKLNFLEESGFFSEISQSKIISREISPEDVQASLTNLSQITFELTDACQMNCYYCGYGDFYCNYDERKNQFMDFSSIKKTIDYVSEYVNSQQNISQGNDLYIGFYGGEPLLNFPVLEEAVNYINSLNWLHNNIRFTVTTNGLLLDKYLDFLVRNNINIFISLDGNFDNNSYRILKNGKYTYDKVLKNIIEIKNKYPEFFAKYVYFNSVLHNKNSVEQIYKYFKETFDKKSNILGLNVKGIREDKLDEFWKAYVNEDQSLYDSEEHSRIEHEMFIKLPTLQVISEFLFRSIDFYFDNYNDLFCYKELPSRYPTDTCMPFSKKLFLTVNGKILPCERIGQEFPLGHLTESGIELDFNEIAYKYNQWFSTIRKQCQMCYGYEQCTQCIFNLNLKTEKTVCKNFQDVNQYSDQMVLLLDFFEDRPTLLNRIIKEVTFG